MHIERIVLISLSLTIFLGSTLALAQVSYSQTDDNVKDLLLKSDLSSITIIGTSSQKFKPDQLSLILNVQTPPSVINSTFSSQEETVNKVVDSVAALQLNQTSVRIGHTNLNPIYSGTQSTAPLFNVYSTVQVQTDSDNLALLSSNLINAGFRIDNIQVSQIKVPINGTISEKSVEVSIVPGSSTPNNLEYYVPSEITVDLGTTVVWTNNDTATHTVTSGQPSIGPTGLFDSALFSPGNTFEHQFNTVGVHDYFCIVHPWMTGTVTVPESDLATETKYQVNINVTIETSPASLADTIKSYKEKQVALQNTLESSGISSNSIQNNSISFNPITYGYGTGQYYLYNTYTQIIVNTDLVNVETVLKTATDSGAHVENIAMSVSDSKIDEIRKDLTHQALEDAMKKAQEILDSTGLQITGIKTIEVNPIYVNQYASNSMYGGMSIWPPYDPYVRMGDETLVSVKVEFEIGRP
ncbi:MAG: SIMPL domain-containing protein [Nitrosopumilaceae archaeon]